MTNERNHPHDTILTQFRFHQVKTGSAAWQIMKCSHLGSPRIPQGKKASSTSSCLLILHFSQIKRLTQL